MKIPTLIRFTAVAAILTAPLGASSQQQATPAFRAYPLQKASSASLSAPPQPNSSSDPRVLELADRLKGTVQQVGPANPAVVPVARGKQSPAMKLKQRARGEVQVRMRPNTGTPRFIEGAALEPASAIRTGRNDEDDVVTARNFLRQNKELLRLNDPDQELVLSKSSADSGNARHLRFVQKHKGVNVWPGEVGVHLDRNGDVYLMTGAYVPTPDIALSNPKITRNAAVQRARIHVPAGNRNSDPELIVYAPGERTPRLAWKLEVNTPLDDEWIVVVDATDGRILTGYNQVANENVSGSGVDLLGQTRPLNVFHQGANFFLVDTSKPMFDPSSQPPSPQTTRGGIILQDGRNQPATNNVRETPPVFDIVSSSATSWDIPQTVSAAYNVSLAYDYYLDRFQRNGWDDKGSNVYVLCRIGMGWPNADMSFTTGVMRIGDADLYAAGLDVLAHEYTHAVTGSTAALIYQNQSGALNESFSDIFGEMAEARAFGSNDWTLGTVLQSAIFKRSLANPAMFTNGGMPYPSKMSEFLNTQNDAGGVHFNSSIHNHCYYLLAEGLDGGIGRADAEKIFYRALTVYLMQNSGFVDARLAAVRAAKDLFGDGSLQAQRTAAAFDGVEIFDAQPTPEPPDSPKVAAEDATLFIYGDPNGGFFLARREAALGDPIEGNFLGQNFAGLRAASVNGAGALGVYVTADNDISLFRTDGQGEQKLGFPGLVNSVAMSPDGSHFGFVLRDSNGQPDNKISVIDVVTPNAQPVTYTLVAPGNDGGTVATIVNADAMAFTANGRYLVYDALDSLQLASGQQIGVYSIYSLDLATGNIQSLVPPIPEYNIGNPSISKTNDNFMTFEAVKVDTGASTVLTADLNSGHITQVGTSGVIAAPKYTGDDKAIVYTEGNPNTHTGVSLVIQAVGDDRQTASGDRSLWLLDGGYPCIYRRGAYQGPPQPSPFTRLANISTRMRVRSGEEVLIAGFIITGNDQKKVIIRGIGPSLTGVGGTLPNPTLRLVRDGATVATNDNWKEHQADVEATTIPPTNDQEPAIVATLDPGSYTAIMEDKNGAFGVGVVEVYDLAQSANSKLANISTRGFIDTGDNVMIGGLIVTHGTDSGAARVIIRALGPSLAGSGVQGALQDPTLELHNADGTTTSSNDNWRQAQEAEIQATTIPPTDDRESAIVSTLLPGNYTAIVRGSGDSTGVGLVEVYHLQ